MRRNTARRYVSAGKVPSELRQVRIPPEVHRRLVIEAEEQNVSLNRLVSAKLAAPLERAASADLREPVARSRTRGGRRG